MDEEEKFTPEGAEDFIAPETKSEIRPFSVEELQSFDNPNMAEYKALYDECRFATGNFAAYSTYWDFVTEHPNYDWQKSVSKIFHEHLSDEILIDIGAGSSYSVEDVAQRFGVAHYIAVDPFSGMNYRWHDVRGELADGVEFAKFDSGTLGYHFRTDGLTFLAQLPSEIASVTINGVDGSIMPYKYMEAIENELKRVVKKKGLLFGAESSPVEGLAREKGKNFSELAIPWEYRRGTILIRNEGEELPELPGLTVVSGGNEQDWDPNYKWK